AFGTAAWSTASRALWQHGPSMLMLTLALYLIVRARERPWIAQLAGLPLAFAYVIRPTNSLSILLLSAFVFLTYRRYFLRYVAGGLMVAVPFFLYNLAVYGAPLSPYYLPDRIGSNPAFLEALAANLVSPARGLFFASPVLLFAL